MPTNDDRPRRLIDPNTGKPYAEGMEETLRDVPGSAFAGTHHGDGARTPSDPRPEFGGTWNWGAGITPVDQRPRRLIDPVTGEPYGEGFWRDSGSVVESTTEPRPEFDPRQPGTPVDGSVQPRVRDMIEEAEQYMRDNPLRGVGDPQGPDPWTTTGSARGQSQAGGYELLNESGRAEFTAAANGEIPGYAIKDPGARALFAEYRRNDPNFGRQSADDFNDSIRGNAAADFLYRDENGNVIPELGINSEEFIREGTRRAQDRQQPRRSGGMGQGPLGRGPDEKTRAILNDRLESIDEAIKNADPNRPRISWGGRGWTIEEINDLKSRIKGALRSYKTGQWTPRDPSVRRGEYKAQRPYRGDGSPNSMGLGRRRPSGGQNRGYGGFVPGETPSYGYNLGAEPSGAPPSGPVPPTMQDAISADGTTLTTSDGFSFPNVTGEGGMSQDAFASAMAENPAADDDLLNYAEQNGLLSDSVRNRLNELDTRRMPDSLTPRQQADYQEQLRRERGSLLYGIAQDATRYEERVRGEAAKAAVRTAEEAASEESRAKRAEETEARAARVERDRLRRIYWANVNPQTKSMLSILNDALTVQPGKEVDWNKLLEELEEDPTKRHLTPEEYMQARQWDEQETARFEASRGVTGTGPAVTAGEQSRPEPTLAAPAADPTEPNSNPWEIEPWEFGVKRGLPRFVTFKATGQQFWVGSYGTQEDPLIFLRLRTQEDAVRLFRDNPEIARSIAGFEVPQKNVDRSRFTDEYVQRHRYFVDFKDGEWKFIKATDYGHRPETPANDRADLIDDSVF